MCWVARVVRCVRCAGSRLLSANTKHRVAILACASALALVCVRGAGTERAELARTDDDLRPRVVRNAAAAASARIDEARLVNGDGEPLTAHGVVLAQWDLGAPRVTHEALASRCFALDGRGASDHGTHVAATLVGDGTAQPTAQGMASGATLLSFDWQLDDAEMRERSQYVAASVHAYGQHMGWARIAGCGDAPVWLGRGAEVEDRAFGKYGRDARALDELAYETGALTVWAAGNERQDVGASGEPHHHFPDCDTTYTDDHAAEVENQFDTIGLQLAAKNALVVGGTAHIDEPPAQPDAIAVLPFSSFGPMDDGRIKPDVVASGALIYSAIAAADDAYQSFSGTSSSAAVVAGGIAVLTALHRELNGGTDLTADAMKALVAHTAISGNADGSPSYASGYGLFDAMNAAELLRHDAAGDDGHRHIALGSVRKGEAVFETRTAELERETAFRVTIAWLDPPGAVNELGVDDPTPALVNDLDLELISPDGATIRLPWSLERTMPTAAATRSGANRVDNLERVDVPASADSAGAWTIRVSVHGALYRQRPQRFALVSSVPFEPAAPILAAPRFVLVETPRGQATTPVAVALQRVGSAKPSTVRARADAPWVSVPDGSAQAPGTISLQLDTAELDVGLHFARLTLEHDDELGPHEVGIVLRVTCAPDCGSRQCGLDPTCGLPCGACAAGESCDSTGQCAPWLAAECPAADLGTTAAQVAALGSTQSAGDDSEGTCGGEGAEDVAFGWTAPKAGVYRFATDGSELDTVLYLRDACDGAELACNDNSEGTTSALSVALEAAQSVTVVVDGSGASSGSSSNFHLSIEEAICPDADIGSRLGSMTMQGSTLGGTDRLASSCFDSGKAEAVFAWTAPTAATYMFSTKRSSVEHNIYIRDGSCAGAELACSGDGEPELSVELEAGQHVVVAVEVAGAQGGGFGLDIRSSDGLCAGSCSGSPNQGECFCDGACVELGDCCEDACALCGSCCVPQCDGRACGADGCGGSCGECPSGERCDAWQCIADPCAGAANGAACDDADPCTEGDQCVGGRCSGAAVECPDTSADAGTVDAASEDASAPVGDAGDADAGLSEASSDDCGCSVPGGKRSGGPGGVGVLVLLWIAIGARRVRREGKMAEALAAILCLFIAVGCDGKAETSDADPPVEEHAGGEAGEGAEMRDAEQVDERAPDSSMQEPGDGDEDAGSPGAPGCGDGECDLLDPLSCGDEQACMLMIDDDSQQPRALCSEAGQGLDGDACLAPQDCSAGLDCTSFDGNGTCRRYCCALNTTAGCPDGQYCRVALEDMSSATGVALCDRCDDCDLADATSCGEQRGCYPLGEGCAACLAAGTKDVGESCQLADECEPGSACFSVGGERRCVAFCVRADGQCPNGQSCESSAELPDDIGVCL